MSSDLHQLSQQHGFGLLDRSQYRAACRPSSMSIFAVLRTETDDAFGMASTRDQHHKIKYST